MCWYFAVAFVSFSHRSIVSQTGSNVGTFKIWHYNQHPSTQLEEVGLRISVVDLTVHLQKAENAPGPICPPQT